MRTRTILIVLVIVLLALIAAFFLSQPAGSMVRNRLARLIARPAGEATLIEVRLVAGEALRQDALDKIAGIPGVVKVEPYLLIETEPHNVVGVEPGAPLRVIGLDNPEAVGEIVAGQDFEAADAGERVVVAGRDVAAEDYGSGPGAMTGMRHVLEIGTSLPLEGSRVRVIGLYAVDARIGEDAVFMPLDMAQTLFGREGQVSAIFVTVDSPQNAGRVAQALQAALGEAVEVVRR